MSLDKMSINYCPKSLRTQWMKDSSGKIILECIPRTTKNNINNIQIKELSILSLMGILILCIFIVIIIIVKMMKNRFGKHKKIAYAYPNSYFRK